MTFSFNSASKQPYNNNNATQSQSQTAGERASFTDAAYVEAGAVVLQNADQMFNDADIFTQIRPPSDDVVPKLAGKTLISMIQPAINPELYQTLTDQQTNVFALDCVPRMLSRGQTFDILSSQANIAGYRAVVEAAEAFPRFATCLPTMWQNSFCRLDPRQQKRRVSSRLTWRMTLSKTCWFPFREKRAGPTKSRPSSHPRLHRPRQPNWWS